MLHAGLAMAATALGEQIAREEAARRNQRSEDVFVTAVVGNEGLTTMIAVTPSTSYLSSLGRKLASFGSRLFFTIIVFPSLPPLLLFNIQTLWLG